MWPPVPETDIQFYLHRIIAAAMEDARLGLRKRTGVELCELMPRAVHLDARRGDAAYAMKVYSAARSIAEIHQTPAKEDAK